MMNPQTLLDVADQLEADNWQRLEEAAATDGISGQMLGEAADRFLKGWERTDALRARAATVPAQ